ncbi:MAG: DUF4142 domain-containing protein [Pseudolabrys sp.]
MARKRAAYTHLSALFAVVAMAAAAAAPSPAKLALSAQDEQFAHKAAAGGALQIALSKIEIDQGRYPKVVQFARTTEKNFAQGAKKLHRLAGAIGIALPQKPPADVRTLARALAADRGDLVDREYMAQMVPASTVAVNVFDAEAHSGKNRKLVLFAFHMLPKLKQHHSRALAVVANMGRAPVARR